MQKPWALVVPMANEENDFHPFINELKSSLDNLKSGEVFLVVDNASKDKTLELCKSLSASDSRFHTVWAPENRNVVDAYLRGYKEALKGNYEYIIEMDAGLSHDPSSLPLFIKYLNDGYECVYGSRLIKGGSLGNSPPSRRFLSKSGTLLANILLGTKLYDMTSGYQGFHRKVVEKFVNYDLQSKAHFYQTEIRYLLRKYKSIEVPINYNAPSPSVSKKAVSNSIKSLWHYFYRRLIFKPVSI